MARTMLFAAAQAVEKSGHADLFRYGGFAAAQAVEKSVLA